MFSPSSPTFSDGYSSDGETVHSPLFSVSQGSADSLGTSLPDVIALFGIIRLQRLEAITGAIDLEGYILTPAVTSMLALSDRQDILNYRPSIKYLYHSHSAHLIDEGLHSYGIKRDYGISYIPQGVGFMEKLSVVSFISAGTISYIAGFSFIIVRHTLRYAISAGI